MIVDRHPMLRAALAMSLRRGGIDVVSVLSSAEAALKALPEHRPDVMLLGLELPGMSGMDLLRTLHGPFSSTRVVVLTDVPKHADAVEAVRLGAWGYLTKHIAPEALARAVCGVHEGHLAMSRPLAAVAMRRLAQLAGSPADSRSADALARLSRRELEILALVAAGLSDRQIATDLGLSPRTVEKHVSNILHKLGCQRRREAAAQFRAGAPVG